MLATLLLAGCGGAPPGGEGATAEGSIINDPGDGEPIDRCPDTNPCVEREWNGSRCVDTRLPNGTPCFDGNHCDGIGECRFGRCTANVQPLSCDDGNPCSRDTCDPEDGCRSVPSTGTPCSDGSSCTVADTCQAGRCVGFGNTAGVPTVPSFSDVFLWSPSGELAEYLGQNYLEGEALDVRVTLPSCAYVTEVQLDGVALDTRPHTACDDANPVDCQPAYYEMWAFNQSNGTLLVLVRIHFGGPGSSGDASEVALVASSAVGQARHAVTVSRVADVVPANHPTQRVLYSISETTLSNGLIMGTYERYGDAGRFTQVDENGTPTATLVSPNYSGMLLEVEPAGFHFVSRVTLDEICHPNARVEGRFILVKEPERIGIQWTEGPSIPITVDFGCNILTLGIVDIIADFIFDEEAREMVDQQVTQQVNMMLGASCGPLCIAQVDRFEYATDELRVLLRPSTAAVVLDVPYWRNLPAGNFTRGFPVAPGTSYAFLGSGLATQSTCRPGSTSPVCGGQRRIGPEGTFLWERPFDAPNGSRVPDPWYNPDGPAAYFGQRAAARARLLGAYRDLPLLPNDALNAGALVARRNTSGVVRQVSDPCGLETFTARRLAFGVNEPGEASYGSGTRRVTVFLSPAIGVPTCPF